MKERFIADNSALAQIACEQASACQSDEVGLLCDQEKAYDRVHPTYSRWKNGPDVFKLFTNIAIALPNLNQIEQSKHYFEEKTFLYF